jgi:predicted nucleic acid-binding protein
VLGPVTIDASVFVRATNLSEPGQQECAEVIAAVGSGHLMVVEPTFVVAEVAGVLGRRRLPAAGVAAVLDRIVRSPVVTLVPLDEAMAEEVAEMAMATHLRAADAIYVATARRYGSTLVTADDEQKLRAQSVIPAMLPAEFLAAEQPGVRP